LVRQHDVVILRIEETPVLGIAAGAGSPVNEDYRRPIALAALIHMNVMSRADVY
jgi:hypothetical protein